MSKSQRGRQRPAKCPGCEQIIHLHPALRSSDNCVLCGNCRTRFDRDEHAYEWTRCKRRRLAACPDCGRTVRVDLESDCSDGTVLCGNCNTRFDRDENEL